MRIEVWSLMGVLTSASLAPVVPVASAHECSLEYPEHMCGPCPAGEDHDHNDENGENYCDSSQEDDDGAGACEPGVGCMVANAWSPLPAALFNPVPGLLALVASGAW